jgi:hypothetical protein
VKPVAEAVFELRCLISKALEEKRQRVREVLSQKKQRCVSMAEGLEALADLFLERHDPIKKAEGAAKKPVKQLVSWGDSGAGKT